MTNPLAEGVARAIAAALPEEAGLDEAAVASMLAPAPKPELGDLAFPCFRLAKALKKGPPIIAKELAERIAASGEPSLIAEAVPTGPYLNVRLDLGQAAATVLPGWARGEAPPTPAQDTRVMVEYSQPNTHKAFHVGHMRNVCLGDSIVRLLRARGYEVVAANYLGDVGAHIAKCLWFYLDELDDEGRQPPETGRGEWLGRIYMEATLKLEDLESAAKPDDAPAEATQALETARARMTEILQKLEAKDPEILKIWGETRQWSLDDFDEIYNWADVHFDRVFYESEVDEPGLKLVEEYLEKGTFVESDGAVGIYNEEVKHMPFFMLRKRDGTGLYATKDLALAQLKFDEYGIDRSIYVVDSRQSDHFKHVFLTLKKMGFDQADKCEHVPYEMVELPSGPMSTRKGTVVLFRELREGLAKALWDSYFHKYEGEWSDEEIQEALRMVSLGAIKYGMLNRDVNQKIVFDLPEWTAVEGDSGPYIQMQAARTASILRKGEERGKTLDLEAHATGALGATQERALVLALAQLPVVAAQAADKLRPSILCSAVYELARAYSRFQTECPVLTSEGELLQGRLLLVAATRGALAWGLDLLGIPAPERM